MADVPVDHPWYGLLLFCRQAIKDLTPQIGTDEGSAFDSENQNPRAIHVTRRLLQQLVTAGLGSLLESIEIRRYGTARRCISLLVKIEESLTNVIHEQQKTLPRAAIAAEQPIAPVAMVGPASTDAPKDVRASAEKLFPKGEPRNRDLVELALKINTEKGSGKSLNQIAAAYAGDPRRAKSLLSSLRRMQREGRVNL